MSSLLRSSPPSPRSASYVCHDGSVLTDSGIRLYAVTSSSFSLHSPHSSDDGSVRLSVQQPSNNQQQQQHQQQHSVSGGGNTASSYSNCGSRVSRASHARSPVSASLIPNPGSSMTEVSSWDVGGKAAPFPSPSSSPAASPSLRPFSAPSSPYTAALSGSSGRVWLSRAVLLCCALVAVLLVAVIWLTVFPRGVSASALSAFPAAFSARSMRVPTESGSGVVDYSHDSVDGYFAPRMFSVVLMNRAVMQCDGGSFGTFDADHVAEESKFHDLFRDYYHSVCMSNLHVTVFHDVNASWVERYQRQLFTHPRTGATYVCDVIMQHVVVPASKLHTFDLRWQIYRDYLLGHPHRYALFTDVSDVRFDADPFEYVQQQVRSSAMSAADGSRTELFVGMDDNPPSEPTWFVPRYDGCELDYSRYANITSLNAGVVGGTYSAALWLTKKMAAAFAHMERTRSVDKCLCLSMDMIMLNSLLLDPTTEDTITTPRPVPFRWQAREPFVGRYKDRENPSKVGEQYIRHKTVLSDKL